MSVSDKKAQLLKAMLKKKGIAAKNVTNKITKISREGKQDFLLSSAQEQLWFQDQLFPNNPVYNIPIALNLRGNINRDILEESISDVIKRHESLRTNFKISSDGPVAVVHDKADFELEYSNDISDKNILIELKNEARLPFDLNDDFLIRAKLWEVNSNDFYLLVTIHHIICEGWSVSIFLNELGIRYNTKLDNTELSPKFDELVLNYVDYSQWQRDTEKNNDNEKHLSYWKEKLSGELPYIEIPLDFSRPAVTTFSGNIKKLNLSKQSISSVTDYCKNNNVTPFVTLFTIFNILLYRYSSSEDILIGTPVSSRSQKELESIIGYFVNTIVLRTSLQGDPSFDALVNQVKTTVLDAFDNQSTPLGKIVDELDIERNLSLNPIFQYMFSLQNTPEISMCIDNVEIKPLAYDEQHTKTSKVDINVVIETNKDEWTVWLEYNSDIFSEISIGKMLEHYNNLLDSALLDSSENISKIPFLSDSEKNTLLKEWNSTDHSHTKDKLIHEVFSQQAKKFPDNIALSYEDTSLTYKELEIKSNRLANFLIEKNVQPDDLIGVCLERSCELIISILAILKSGAAYLPLDPNVPIERLSFIVGDAGISILLTEKKHLNLFSKHENKINSFNVFDSKINKFSDVLGKTHVLPSNIAYVIYTSGSTGKPKGVLVEHRNVIRLFTATNDWYQFNSDDVWTLFHSCTFDFSVWEIWGALFYGGQLVVVPYWISRSPEDFFKLIVDENVTVLNQTPSAFKQLVNFDVPKKELALRYIIFGGEALDLESLRPWFNRYGDSLPSLINMYGITETTVHVTYRHITLKDVDENNGSIIGVPIPDLQTYLLDQNLQLVPIGVTGEIFVGGDGVTRGYLNRPELNNERFIKNHITGISESKLYRSGDLARYLPNGDLEYLGRIDNQVKIRGFRIELGEIESVINTLPDIKQVVVVVLDDKSSPPYIVAYYISHSNNLIKPDDVRKSIAESLPDYMIPQFIIEIDKIELTSNGKVDYKKLPIPLDQQEIDLSNFVAAKSDTEKRIVDIWQDVIGVSRVGVCDDFFSIGGHSLLATQVLTRIKEEFNVELALRKLFENSTIKKISIQVDELLNHAHEIVPDKIKKLDSYKHIPLSFSQQRLWFLDQLDPNNPVYNVPLAYNLKGKLDVKLLTDALKTIFGRHDIFQTSFEMLGDEPIQVINKDLNLNVDVIDSNNISDEEITKFISEKSSIPFSLSTSPLLHIYILTVSDDFNVLLFVSHHMVFDGWSARIFMDELRIIYKDFCNDVELSITKPQLQYADYTVWQRNWLKGNKLQEQLDYWKKHLNGELPLLELPTDFTRPNNFTYEGKCLHVNIPKRLMDGISNLSHKYNATPYMLTLAAYTTLLFRYTSQTDIITGTIMANRNHADIDSMIGYFANTIALRSRFNESTSFLDMLSLTREVCLNAYAYQDLPFERLVEELNPKRNSSYTPIYQTLFSYEQFPELEHPLGDITLEQVHIDNGVARTDISMTIQEVGNGCGKLLIEYCDNLFEEKYILRFIEHYINILNDIIKNPNKALSEIDVLTNNEDKLFRSFNNTFEFYDHKLLLHETFERQVKNSSDNTAIEFEGQSVTYKEFNDLCNIYVNHLINAGVSKKMYVGVYMLRSIEMLVSIYSLLKLGAAYVPIDPEYPSERTEYIISDANIDTILTHKHVDYTWLNCSNIIDVETINLNGENKTNDVDISPDNIAYVIYTSGTTGKPKGVMVSHQAIVNRLDWMQKEYGLTENDVVLQKTPYSFDVSVWELFWPLMVGAKLQIAKPEGHKDPSYLKEIIKLKNITTLHFVPSMLNVFLDIETFSDCPKLKRVFCSGEALAYETTQLFFDDSTAQLHNLYGPTEAAVDVTYWKCVKDNPRKFIPIGKAVNNTQLYVLDKNMNQVPLGVIGELFIAGDQLANGYLNKPELTNEKFINNIFSDNQNDKMYRTGDLVKYHDDGNIEYIGRTDFQVKVRGFRIELGEIETAFNSLPEIKRCVVTVHQDDSKIKGIVAYYILNSGSEISLDKIRLVLSKKLPDYMVPQFLVNVDAFILTANGKVDYKALPSPLKNIRGDLEYVAPTNDTELRLQEIWQNVMSIEKISVYDNFFEIGGHSLLATKLVSRVQNCFEIKLSLRILFESSSISKLAYYIDNQPINIKDLYAEKITKYTGLKSIPLSFSQQRLWYLDQLETGNSVYNLPLVYKLKGNLNVDFLVQSLHSIIRRHDILRTNFKFDDLKPTQVLSQNIPIDIDRVDLSEYDNKSVRRYISDKISIPFKLDEAPLVRMSILKLADSSNILFINFHHSIFDGWSTSVFMEELRILYTSFLKSEQPNLLDLDIQYSDFSVWQRSWLKGKVLNQQLKYWKSHLDGDLPVLELPTDYLRPTQFSYVGNTISLNVPNKLMSKLNDFSLGNNFTPFMVTLATYVVLLYRYTSQNDIVCGTVIANRNHTEVENLLGYFSNTLAIRTKFNKSLSFIDILTVIRESCLDAYANQDLPFEKLVEELNPIRDISRTPIFQTLFLYEKNTSMKIPFSDIELEQLHINNNVSRTDISLIVVETDSGGEVHVEYCTDLFQKTSITRFIEHYLIILEQVLEDKTSLINELNILTVHEEDLLLKFNDTNAQYNNKQLLHASFDDMAVKKSSNIAIEFDGLTLSYKEFDARCNVCMEHMLQCGVVQNSYVGIYMLRSVEMLVAIYSILKLGSAYVPIDPDHPKDRVDYIIDDARISFILSHREVDYSIIEPSKVIDISLLDYKKISGNLINIPHILSSSIAYVIYTSGTTGKPKGVMVSHQAIVNRLDWMQKEYDLTENDVVLQKTPYSFDVSVWELFWPLMVGAKLQIAKPEGHKDPSYLKEIIKLKNITTLHFVPSMLNVFLDVETFSDCTNLKRVFCSGEALAYETTQLFFDDSTAELHNLYGPTEAAVDVTYWRCVKDNPRKFIPIGKAVNNTQLYVLDKHMNQVPLGVIGELFIAGDQLANGYLNNPELTKEKFIDNLFTNNQNDKMYRTGDLVKYHDDGNIEYIGRTDFQVKINGLRIELGEIESALNSHSKIKESVVLLDNNGLNHRLVGYYVIDNDTDINVTEIIKYLRSIIPGYMIPQNFVELESIPLTASGKVDRKSLPSPLISSLENNEYVQPSTDMEVLISKIWSDILNKEKISVNDNFFEIGGHSLLSIKVIATIHKQIGVKLELRLIVMDSLKQIAASCDAILKQSATKHSFISRLYSKFKNLIKYN